MKERSDRSFSSLYANTLFFCRYVLIVFIYLSFLTAEVSAQENSAILCADGLDNDGNGEIDCQDQKCREYFDQVCVICGDDGISFADTVITYVPGCPGLKLNRPSAALGVADWNDPGDGHAVVLGEGGLNELGFTNNILINSGDTAPDLIVFEVGDVVEECMIYGRPFDAETGEILNVYQSSAEVQDGYYFLGKIEGTQKSVDLDASYSGLAGGALRFDRLRILDVPDLDCLETINPGADIDAVCAVSFLPIDCLGKIGGWAKINKCGICLSPDDKEYHADCEIEIFIPSAFTPNGDGENDLFRFYLPSSRQARIGFMNIYNHWGQKIHHIENVDILSENGLWDGTIGGIPAPPGSYFYRSEILVPGSQKRVYSGLLHLIR
ncbi:MAG: gliding motility-associated C-terminal domain-containing protein [Saprospiraceae bacterium]|nr:gliding motility-associated C-terminal domain-containing protein [Saprospiraceae bacterium]